MSKELQKDEFYLKGDLEAINGSHITEIFKGKDRATTLTITPNLYVPIEWGKKKLNTDIVEDADFEIIPQKQIEDTK